MAGGCLQNARKCFLVSPSSREMILELLQIQIFQDDQRMKFTVAQLKTLKLLSELMHVCPLLKQLDYLLSFCF